MTVLHELRTGHLSQDFGRLLYRTMAKVATIHNFPPPEGHGTWTVDAIHVASHDLLTEDEAKRRLLELAAKAADDASLERLLATTVRNYLRTQGRRTTLGKLIVRLKPLLRDDPRFIRVPDGQPGERNYALAGGPTDPYAGDPHHLHTAAKTVTDITVVRWSINARREGPLADTPSLLRLAETVLAAAQASLRIDDLAHILATRLGVNPANVPVTLPVDDIDDHGHDPAPDPTDADPGAQERADIDALLAQLSTKEQLVFAWLHTTVRDIAEHTGLAVSTAGAVKQRVTTKLATMLATLDPTASNHLAVKARDHLRAQLDLEPIHNEPTEQEVEPSSGDVS